MTTALVVAILTSACVGKEPAPVALASPSAELSPTTSPFELPLVAPPAEPPPEPPKTLEWFSENLTGNVSLEVRFATEKGTECVALVVFRGTTGRPGPLYARIMRTGSGYGWSSGATAEAAHVHVEGLVDTRDVQLSQGGMWASWGRFKFKTSSGNVSLMAIARDLKPNDLSLPAPPEWNLEFPARASLYVGIDCTKPIALSALYGGREALLFNHLTMRGGVGAHVLFEASAALANEQQKASPAPHMQFIAGSFGFQLGRLVLTHPGGTKEWIMDPVSFSTGLMEVRGGPGTYSARLDRVAGFFDAFWAAFAPMHSLTNLDQILEVPSG